MGFAAQLRAFRDKTVDRLDAVVRLTIQDAGGRLIELSPIGDPALWMKAPPAHYQPGTFVSNWFYSRDAFSTATQPRHDVREVNGLAEMGDRAGGHRHYIQNSLPYAQALEYGHSSQAPVGIIAVIEPELADIAYAAARRVAE